MKTVVHKMWLAFCREIYSGDEIGSLQLHVFFSYVCSFNRMLEVEANPQELYLTLLGDFFL